ncbi:hypothetical protein A3E49_00555 [Candidatus Saccharibacteria bacterium RIFCSPHIGHO2_12_FULL_49_19]|nr:MAG: hypothetical protein A2708_00920 [Candidatus Saccharibacteria bacterium RIFCSPHIGHO2_01_FULL_49_21]OGL36736.1 MAG: hypothetical protein A3E49_00555 [Candidatus Saccharibacteria bacterium RIFCSPHIGHO2_12_FULL_49_19]
MEQTANLPEPVRPTKKQRELLSFIEEFITAHGYSPSYREIMKGLGYTSVATVSLHINNLIRRGHLQKRNRSARSLELTNPTLDNMPKLAPKQLKASEEKWLVEKVELFFSEAEKSRSVSEREMDQLYVLTGALKVLGLEGAANSFISRLSEIKKRSADGHYST